MKMSFASGVQTRSGPSKTPLVRLQNSATPDQICVCSRVSRSSQLLPSFPHMAMTHQVVVCDSNYSSARPDYSKQWGV